VSVAVQRLARVPDLPERELLVGDGVAVQIPDLPRGVVVRPVGHRVALQPENARGALVGEDEPSLAVEPDDTRRDRLQDLVQAVAAPVSRVGRPPGRDRVVDAVRKQDVPVPSATLLEVVGDARGDRVARDLLAPGAGEQDEREVGTVRADGLEELDPVHAGHVVVADDAVDRRGVVVGESF